VAHLYDLSVNPYPTGLPNVVGTKSFTPTPLALDDTHFAVGVYQYPAGFYAGITYRRPGWMTLTSDTTARDYLAAAYDPSANLTYAIDGYRAGYTSVVTAYSKASNSWTALASDTIARGGLAGVHDSSANLTYAIDGYTGSVYTAAITAYSKASNSWTSLAGDPTGRDGLAGAYDSSANLTYAIDGYNGDTVPYLIVVTAYSKASNSWTGLAGDTTERGNLAAVYDSSANLTYAIDGYNGNIGTYFSVVTGLIY